MNSYTCKQRKNIGHGAAPWTVNDPDGERVALAETKEQGNNLARDLTELRSLRVLVAVAAKQLAVTQACAMLNCTPEQLQARINTCLTRGFK